jgi:hypothetical protein
MRGNSIRQLSADRNSIVNMNKTMNMTRNPISSNARFKVDIPRTTSTVRALHVSDTVRSASQIASTTNIFAKASNQPCLNYTAQPKLEHPPTQPRPTSKLLPPSLLLNILGYSHFSNPPHRTQIPLSSLLSYSLSNRTDCRDSEYCIQSARLKHEIRETSSSPNISLGNFTKNQCSCNSASITILLSEPQRLYLAPFP